MKICILVIGTRGDVQPCIALGLGLKAAGYQVQIATYTAYKAFVCNQGLDFFPIAGDPEIWYANYSENAAQSIFNTLDVVRCTARLMRLLLPDLLKDSWLACQDADVIIASPFVVSAYHIAEKLNIPIFFTWSVPGARTQEFPHPCCHSRGLLGKTGNWLTYFFLEQLLWQPVRPIVNHWRQQTLGLPPIPLLDFDLIYRQQVPLIYNVSPAVIKKPHDWEEWMHLSGFWFLDSPVDWKPSSAVVSFLAAGPPPIYIGFGSAVNQDAKAFTELIVEALIRTGQRGILDVSWGGLARIDLPEQFLVVESADAPHDWLLPQVSAMVHHGGGGTTAAGLRAGIPAVTVPMLLLQFFWGDRLAELGVSPPPIAKDELTVDRLATAIQEVVNNQAMRDRAALLGEKIRAENGVERAVEIIQHHLTAKMPVKAQ